MRAQKNILFFYCKNFGFYFFYICFIFVSIHHSPVLLYCSYIDIFICYKHACTGCAAGCVHTAVFIYIFIFHIELFSRVRFFRDCDAAFVVLDDRRFHGELDMLIISSSSSSSVTTPPPSLSNHFASPDCASKQ